MPTNSNTAIGAVVRDARKRSRLSQDRLGKASGLTGGHLSRMERGHYDPRLSSLRQVAPALGLTLQELIARYELRLDPSTDEHDPSGAER